MRKHFWTVVATFFVVVALVVYAQAPAFTDEPAAQLQSVLPLLASSANMVRATAEFGPPLKVHRRRHWRRLADQDPCRHWDWQIVENPSFVWCEKRQRGPTLQINELLTYGRGGAI